MKKIIVAFAVLVACSISVQAQYFVGGRFGFNTSGGSSEVGGTSSDKPKSTSFNFSPKVGMFLSEKLAVGAELNFGINNTKTYGMITTTTKSTGFGISPFVRYYVVQMDKFGIFAEGKVGVNFSSTETTGSPKAKTTSFGINVAPVMYYNLTEKLSLEASVNLFNFGFNTSTTKFDDNKDTSNSFGFGAGTNGLVNTGSISIGAIYKF